MKTLRFLFAALVVTLVSAAVLGTPQVAEAKPAPAESLSGEFCCDVDGYRRCTLDWPAPVGFSCYCRGQGRGYVCM